MPVQVLRTGKLPARPAQPRLEIRRALSPLGLTEPPARVDYSDIPDIGMLGNDMLGDCVPAGIGHVVEQDTRYATGTEQIVTAEQTVEVYSAVAGYVPGDPSTDQGTVVQDALGYWRKTGVFGGHKIAAFAAVNLTDWSEIGNCVNLFGQVVLGFNFPESAMGQFNRGEPWTVVPGSRLEGAHCVVMVGYDADWLYMLTWGRVQRMARAFWTRYVDEAWVVITQDTINAQGVNAFGGVLDLATLGADFSALTREPNPFPHVDPAPPEPSPSPAPTPPPSPAPVGPTDRELVAFLTSTLVQRWLHGSHYGTAEKVARELRAWLKAVR